MLTVKLGCIGKVYAIAVCLLFHPLVFKNVCVQLVWRGDPGASCTETVYYLEAQPHSTSFCMNIQHLPLYLIIFHQS